MKKRYGNRKRASFRRHARSAYRSGLEATIAAMLAAAKVPAQFEPFKIPFVQPEKQRTYTPDFLLPNHILIETKGMLTLADRQKHEFIQAQRPELDIRFVFQNAKGKLSKGSKTTYAMWAEKKGFKWAHKTIPDEWLTEPNCPVREGAVSALQEGE